MHRYLLVTFSCLFALLAVAADEPLARESANLSSDQYRNPYYGLGLVLPSASRVTRRQVSEQPPGVHALLALRFDRPTDAAALTVYATDARSGLTLDPKEAARQQVEECKRLGMSFRRGPFEVSNTHQTRAKIPPDTVAQVVEEFNTPTGEFM